MIPPFEIYHQRGKAYGFLISIKNDKNQIKSFDSLHYSVYDSLKKFNNNGYFVFGKDLHKQKPDKFTGSRSLPFETSYSINISPKDSMKLLGGF